MGSVFPPPIPLLFRWFCKYKANLFSSSWFWLVGWRSGFSSFLEWNYHFQHHQVCAHWIWLVGGLEVWSVSLLCEIIIIYHFFLVGFVRKWVLLECTLIQMWWLCVGRGSWEAGFGGLELGLGDKSKAEAAGPSRDSASIMTLSVMLSTLTMAILASSARYHQHHVPRSEEQVKKRKKNKNNEPFISSLSLSIPFLFFNFFFFCLLFLATFKAQWCM